MPTAAQQTTASGLHMVLQHMEDSECNPDLFFIFKIEHSVGQPPAFCGKRPLKIRGENRRQCKNARGMLQRRIFWTGRMLEEQQPWFVNGGQQPEASI